MEEQPFIYFKIFLLGKKGVGKSTLAKFSSFNTFSENSRLTIGIDYLSYNYSFTSSNKNNFARISIWAYNPESHFKEMFNNYLTGSKAILIMFDISELNSLKEIDSWMRVIRKRHNNIPIMLLGNKADLTEHLEPAKSLADSLVKKYGLMGYYEMSALESKNIELILATMAETLLKKLNPNLIKSS